MAHAIMERPDDVGRYLGYMQITQQMQQRREQFQAAKQKAAQEMAMQMQGLQMRQAEYDLAVRRQVMGEQLAQLQQQKLDPTAIFERTWAAAMGEAGAEAATPMGRAELKKKLADALKAEVAAREAEIALTVQEWGAQQIPVTGSGEQQALGLPPSVTQQPQGVGGVGEMGSPFQLAPGALGQPVQQPGMPQFVPPTAPREAVIETREQLRGEGLEGRRVGVSEQAEARRQQEAAQPETISPRAYNSGVRGWISLFLRAKAGDKEVQRTWKDVRWWGMKTVPRSFAELVTEGERLMREVGPPPTVPGGPELREPTDEDLPGLFKEYQAAGGQPDDLEAWKTFLAAKGLK